MRAEVTDSAAVAEAGNVGSIGNGEKAEGDVGREELLLAMLRDVNEIVNRGGSCEERVLEIRGRLAEGVKLLGVGGN